MTDDTTAKFTAFEEVRRDRLIAHLADIQSRLFVATIDGDSVVAWSAIHDAERYVRKLDDAVMRLERGREPLV